MKQIKQIKKIIIKTYYNTITIIKRLFCHEWVEWETYNNRIKFLENFNFQQETRKQNIKNSSGVGKSE